MAYATTAQFAALGLPAAALVGFSGDVQDHLDAATGIVESYLRGRYSLPITTPPFELVQATCSIAAYSVLSIRGFDPENGADVNIRMRYEDAMKLLRGLADGTINLAIDVDSTPAVHDGRPVVSSRARNTSGSFRGLGTDTIVGDC